MTCSTLKGLAKIGRFTPGLLRAFANAFGLSWLSYDTPSERLGYSALSLRGLMTMMNQALHLGTELDYLRPQP
jgi:hypothetical protein